MYNRFSMLILNILGTDNMFNPAGASPAKRKETHFV